MQPGISKVMKLLVCFLKKFSYCRRATIVHQENIDFTYRALSVLETAYCDLIMFLSPIKQKVSKSDSA